MEIETVIEGRAFINGEISYAEIGITDGKIVAAGKMVRGGDKRIDVGTSGLILPGFTDPHVHFRDPGMTHKEDFLTGTMSALYGGVTCVLDMPNTKPPVSDVETILSKKSAVRNRAYVDYGLFAALTPGCRPALMAPLVPGFKLFMGSTTGNILMNDDEDIASVMADVKATGKTLSVHAEDDSMILKNPENSTQEHLRNRPLEAETNAINRLGRYKGQKINICHNTSSECLKLSSEYGFTTEVTLHHLLFDTDRHRSAEYKVNPPLRNSAVREALWKAFSEGKATMFGSDHAPHTSEEKEADFDSAPGGIPGVETTMPIVMNMVRQNTLSLSRAVSMGAENPGKVFGIGKGMIKAGYDADFAIFDLRKTSEINVKNLHGKSGHTPYGGMEAVFPQTVMVRGQIQISEGEFCGDRIGEDICG